MGKLRKTAGREASPASLSCTLPLAFYELFVVVWGRVLTWGLSLGFWRGGGTGAVPCPPLNCVEAKLAKMRKM